jgi:D-glycero-D-manno-heptose 1,7-bisphosphate phosphatase
VRTGRAGDLVAVFLDRDGVLNRKAPEGEYVTSVDELDVLPGAPEAVRKLKQAGLHVVVVTNQRGIARGRMTEDDLAEIHAALQQQLGGLVDAIEHCPHEGGCDCRKPGTAMFERAAARLGFDPAASAVIGDRADDMVAAGRIGALRVHVRGYDEPLPEIDYDAADVLDAAEWLLATSRSSAS